MIQTIVIAEKATLDYFSLDRVMNAIMKAFETVKEPASDDIVERVLGKLTMTQYTYADLGGKMKAQVDDGRKHGMFDVMDLEGEVWDDFLDFHRNISRYMSWEQSAAVYWSQKIPDCWLVSESEQVLDYAQGLGVPIMIIQ